MAIRIKKITKLNQYELTGDIEVNKTHSYQLDNGVISHNSTLLSTASGIHGEHSKRYFRIAQMNKDSDVAKLLHSTNPDMLEEGVWSVNRTDYAVFFPVVSKEGSIYKKDLLGVKLLEKVKFVQQSWIEAGTDVDLCVKKSVRHNVSNTIDVDDWDQVENYLWDNKEYFAGVSLMPATGDKDYAQAPNTEVLSEKEIAKKYGRPALFASGLIVDGLKAFQNDLWLAIDTARNNTGEELNSDNHDILMKKDWVRRFKKFAKTYFDEDFKEAEYCLKDVHLLYRWDKVQRNMVDIDWKSVLVKSEEKLIDIDTMAAQSCVGNGCEIV